VGVKGGEQGTTGGGGGSGTVKSGGRARRRVLWGAVDNTAAADCHVRAGWTSSCLQAPVCWLGGHIKLLPANAVLWCCLRQWLHMQLSMLKHVLGYHCCQATAAAPPAAAATPHAAAAALICCACLPACPLTLPV
jgi:hypothetical protein